MGSATLTSETKILSTITAGEFCPLCGGEGTALGMKDNVKVRECKNGHAPIQLAWAWNSVEEYENFYEDDCQYHIIEQKRGGQAGFFERDTECLKAAYQRLSLIEFVAPPHTHPSLCDIGAGNGAFAAMATSRGYRAWGLEPNPAMVAYAESHGRFVQQGEWKALLSSHVVTLCDVWEHLTQPMECLQHLKSALEGNGVIYIEVPEWDCEQQRTEGLAWKHARVRQHIWLPSDGAAQEMFRQVGLKVDALFRPHQGRLGKIAYLLSAR